MLIKEESISRTLMPSTCLFNTFKIIIKLPVYFWYIIAVSLFVKLVYSRSIRSRTKMYYKFKKSKSIRVNWPSLPIRDNVAILWPAQIWVWEVYGSFILSALNTVAINPIRQYTNATVQWNQRWLSS